MPAQTLSSSAVRSWLKGQFATGECLALTLSGRRAEPAEPPFRKVTARPVVLRTGPQWQLTFHTGRQETHENRPDGETARHAAHLLETLFDHLHLFTEEADYELRRQRDGQFQVRQRPPSKAKPAAVASHNREKQYLIPEGVPCPFLFEIGVMSPAGKVLAAKYHKFRQINRFLELVNDVLPAERPARPWRVIDFGSGKSYLTFALHHLLTEIRGFDAEILGVDRNPDVIRTCTAVAERLQCLGLRFETGEIANCLLPEGVDLVVSLHACDTATDDALAQAVHWNAGAILAVPCCQHELAGKIAVEGFAPLAQHGILHERFAALATDALRAAALELCGYEAQVLEFIDLEHTAKNLLIRAVRTTRREDADHERRERYRQFKTRLGLERPYLEIVLGDRLPAGI